MTFFLSITSQRLISLWDSPAKRLAGAQNEKFVNLVLTDKQIHQLFKGVLDQISGEFSKEDLKAAERDIQNKSLI